MSKISLRNTKGSENNIKPLELRATTLIDKELDPVEQYVNFDKEYYNRLSSLPISNKSSYTGRQIAGAQVIRQYGARFEDVTHEYYTDASRNYEQMKEEIEPVIDSQLLATNMTDACQTAGYGGQTFRNTKRYSLEKHEDAGIQDSVSAPSVLVAARRRKSMDITQQIMFYQMKKNEYGPWRLRSPQNKSANICGEYGQKNVELLSVRESMELQVNAHGLGENHQKSTMKGSKLTTKRSIPLNGQEKRNIKAEPVATFSSANGKRSVSIGELQKGRIGGDNIEFLTNYSEISELELDASKVEYAQRRPSLAEAVRVEYTKRRLSVNTDSGEETINNRNLGLVGAQPVAENITVMKEKSAYEIRREYGKNLEKNWFKAIMQRVKKTSNVQKKQNIPYDPRSDLFYSPEPEFEQGRDINNYNRSYYAKSTHLTKGVEFENRQKGVKERMRSSKNSAIEYSSTEVLCGEDGELERSTPSDIEFGYNGNQLVQRKTKHKMHRKRLRQRQRFSPFFDGEDSDENDDAPFSQGMTDAELRALRLNLGKNKVKKSIKPRSIKGRRKFKQVANAVFAVVVLNDLVRSKKQKRSKRRKSSPRKKHKKVTWRSDAEDMYSEYERRESTPMTIGKKFMNEFGRQLLDDMNEIENRLSNLGVSINVADYGIQPELLDHDGATSVLPTQTVHSGDQLQNTDCAVDAEVTRNARDMKYSAFANELKRVSLNDADIKYAVKRNSSCNLQRRKSDPGTERPEEFLIEIPEKVKGKSRNRSKSRGRNENNSKSRGRMASVAKRAMEMHKKSLKPNCSCSNDNHKNLQPSKPRSRSMSASRQSKENAPKVQVVIFRKSSVLKRQLSLPNLPIKDHQEVDLMDLLRDVDIPDNLKKIRIQIIKRKMKRRKTRQERKASFDELTIESSSTKRLGELEEDEQDETESDDSEASDYSFYNNIGYSPFVSSGVAWSQRRDRRRSIFTVHDVDQEVKRVSRLFYEMKDCKYIRWPELSQAVIKKLHENEDK